jgi:hypothetical protein
MLVQAECFCRPIRGLTPYGGYPSPRLRSCEKIDFADFGTLHFQRITLWITAPKSIFSQLLRPWATLCRPLRGLMSAKKNPLHVWLRPCRAVLLSPNFFATREDFVARGSRSKNRDRGPVGSGGAWDTTGIERSVIPALRLRGDKLSGSDRRPSCGRISNETTTRGVHEVALGQPR